MFKKLSNKAVSFISTCKNKAISAYAKTVSSVNCLLGNAKYTLQNNNGSGLIEYAGLILASVVLVALLLAGLYTLFGETILPNLKTKIEGLFNYAG